MVRQEGIVFFFHFCKIILFLRLKFYNNARKSVTNEPIDCSLSPSFRSPLISNEEVLSPPILRKEQKFGPNKREADLSVEENAKIPKKLKKKISAMDKKATKNAEKLKRDLRKRNAEFPKEEEEKLFRRKNLSVDVLELQNTNELATAMRKCIYYNEKYSLYYYSRNIFF